MNLEKKLYKSNKNKMVGGVCGGIGEYFHIDPTLVRLGFVALCVLAGGGLLAYIVALIVIPEAPAGYNPAEAGEQTTSAGDDENSNDTPTMI